MATALDNLARKQIYIPATQPETVQLRVAAYCRVSTDSDDQMNSFAAQNTHYNRVITQHDLWELVDIYADSGITGTSAAKRQDFQRMLADCRKGKIDKILVKSISRFARNSMECLETIRELKALGISVFFEEHNIDTKMVSSEMLTAVIAACAQAESESISKNMRWSYQKRMASGNFNTCRAPLGFRIEKGGLIIHTEEAKVVYRIFEDYLRGKNTREIAKELTEGKILDKAWNHVSIKYILANERYAGNALLQKRYQTNEFPRATKYNKGERPMFYVEGSNAAIIPKEMFDRATELRNHRKNATKKSAARYFAKKLVCGNCGDLFRAKQVKKIQYWVCMTHGECIEKCALLPVPETEIVSAFLRFYYNMKAHPEIVEMLIRSERKIHSRQMLWGEDIVSLNKEISDLISQSYKLTTMNRRGLVDPDIFIIKSNQLAEQLRKAKQEKERLQKQNETDFTESTQQIMDVLADGPEFLDTFDEELFYELIDKIIVDSNTKIRFRLKNGLELPESIERTVR